MGLDGCTPCGQVVGNLTEFFGCSAYEEEGHPLHGPVPCAGRSDGGSCAYDEDFFHCDGRGSVIDENHLIPKTSVEAIVGADVLIQDGYAIGLGGLVRLIRQNVT